MRRLIYICSIGAVLATSSPALAKDPPVFVDPDPDSPAGTEYAIPLDRARDEVAGNSEGSNGAAPLFGDGVSNRSEAAANAGGTGGSGPGGSAGGSGGGGSGGSGGSGSGGSGPSTADLLPAASEGGGSSTALTIGIPLAVLAFGGAIALVVFSVRSLRSPPTTTT